MVKKHIGFLVVAVCLMLSPLLGYAQSPTPEPSPSASPTATPSPCDLGCDYNPPTIPCEGEACSVAFAQNSLNEATANVDADTRNIAFDNTAISVTQAAISVINSVIAANTSSRAIVAGDNTKCWIPTGPFLTQYYAFEQATGGTVWRYEAKIVADSYVAESYKETWIPPTPVEHDNEYHPQCASYIETAVPNDLAHNNAHYNLYDTSPKPPFYKSVAHSLAVYGVTPNPNDPNNTNGHCNASNDALIDFFDVQIALLNVVLGNQQAALTSWQDQKIADLTSKTTHLADVVNFTADLTTAQIGYDACKTNAFPGVTYSCACGD